MYIARGRTLDYGCHMLYRLANRVLHYVELDYDTVDGMEKIVTRGNTTTSPSQHVSYVELPDLGIGAAKAMQNAVIR